MKTLRFIILLLIISFLHEQVFSMPLNDLQASINNAISNVKPSIVTVKAQKTGFESIGSGFIVDIKGYVLTNYHVIKDAQNIYISFWQSGHKTVSATLMDSDKSIDLALIKINDIGNFTSAPLGNSDFLKTGDLTICVGSPFGLKNSVTLGIVSDLHREMLIEGISYKDMIQTDAVINEGNSGGPLINIFGKVVGVGTAIYAPEGTYRGIGFAIPINRAKHFYSRVTGVVLAAANIPVPNNTPKESINLNKKIPNDKTHTIFSDCRECHTISQKSVVSLKSPMPHPPLKDCGDCHILTNDKVTKGSIKVASNQPIQNKEMFGFFLRSLLLILFGLFVGSIGTMVGVGGGFIHVPFLMIACGFSVQSAIGTSIGIIFFNTLAGSFMYFYQKRIDISLAKKLSLAVIPGAIFGPFIVQKYSNDYFLLIFSALLLIISCYLFFTNSQINILSEDKYNKKTTIHDREGNKISYSTNYELGYLGTFIIGFISNLLGIGGGIIHIPFLILFLKIPVHIALGTSHLILCISSFLGTIMFLLMGNIHIDYMMPIAMGSIFGARIGVELSKSTSGIVIRRILALILFLVSFKIFFKHIGMMF
ncbi:MAG: TSUP family transporter [Desulfobacterales bacterium]|nr:TSUP family transporter [Desulfobacterales bacterium]